MVTVSCLNTSLAIDDAVDNNSLYLIPLVWISSGVLLVMVAAVMVVWLEVVCVCVCVCVCACVRACVCVCMCVYAMIHLA